MQKLFIELLLPGLVVDQIRYQRVGGLAEVTLVV